MKYKKCPICEKILTTDYFYRSKQARDGVSYECKECHAQSSRDREYIRIEKRKKRRALYAEKINRFTTLDECDYSAKEFNVKLEENQRLDVDKIRKLMSDKSMNQMQLAAATKIERSQISKYLSRGYKPYFHKLHKIALALNVNGKDIIVDEN